MAQSDSAAVLRADINVLVEEASAANTFFIGHRAMPPFEVDAQDGQYPVFKKGKGELLNDDVAIRKPGGSYGRVRRTYENDTYSCDDRGLEEAVDDTYRKNMSRYFDAEVTAAKQTMTQVMLGHEIRVESEIMSTTNFGSGTNSNVAYTEANIATINFPLDVLDSIERVNDEGEEANTIILSSTVLNRLKRSTLLQNWVRGNRPSDSTLNLTPSAIAEAFAENGIQQVLVGRARKNSAKKGQSYSASNVWGNTYVWVGKVASGDFSNQGAGRTLVWNKEGGLWVTESYREESTRSDIVRVRQNTTEKCIDGTAGDLITTQYA